jgi:hypothetical protein
MHPLAHMVGQPAYRQHIRRAVERQPVVEVEPFTSHHPGGDGLKPRVVSLKRMTSKRPGFRNLDLHIKMIQNSVLVKFENLPLWFSFVL